MDLVAIQYVPAARAGENLKNLPPSSAAQIHNSSSESWGGGSGHGNLTTRSPQYPESEGSPQRDTGATEP